MKKYVRYYLYIFSCDLGRYVGVTSNPHKRKNKHINKYGLLKFHVIKILYNRKEAIGAETNVINRIGLDNLINKNRSGYCHSKKIREKMSKALLGNKYCLGRKLSEETKKKIGKVHLGKILNKETKEKLRKAMLENKNNLGYKNALGHKHTKEAKEKIRLAMLGRKLSNKTKEKLSLAKLGNKNGLGNKNRLGKSHSKEAKEKMSIAWIKRKRRMCIKRILKEIKSTYLEMGKK